MARNIAQIVDLMRFIVRKQLGVYVSIEEATATLDSVQIDYFEKLFSDFAETQKIHDGLMPFLVSQSFASNSSGIVEYQDDYMHFASNASTVFGSTLYKIKFVNPDEWADATRSQLRAPTLTSAIAKSIGKDNTASGNGGFQICPFTIINGTYDYLRRPVAPVYDYTQVGRVITYLPLSSTQMQWNDNYINPIMFLALSYWGINMNENSIVEYSEMQKQQIE